MFTERFYQVFEKVGKKNYQITDLGQTGAVNANLRPTKALLITLNTFHGKERTPTNRR